MSALPPFPLPLSLMGVLGPACLVPAPAVGRVQMQGTVLLCRTVSERFRYD
jgi:hypothetical protein